MILVTGGAGYVGSQAVYQLLDAGEQVIVLDNLQTGDRRSVEGLANCELVIGDVGDTDLLIKLFKEKNIEVVMHFAASTSVLESMQHPNKYYLNNLSNTAKLLQVCQQVGLKYFIFSSTAAVYGAVKSPLVSELAATCPINPYGWSKWMAEKVLADVSSVSPMKYMVLRYFNVAGADPALRVGPYAMESYVLIRQAVQVALGLHKHLSIYGDDYTTPDGTGVRDYIHVADIASAHIAALRYLRAGRQSEVVNCGSGQGYSVREVVQTLERLIGKSLPIEVVARRPGDPDCVLADTQKIHRVLDWQPQYHELTQMLSTALEWEKKLHDLHANKLSRI